MIKTEILFDKNQTVKMIKFLVGHFYKDLENFSDIVKMDIEEYYDLVKNIPYKKDEKGLEVTARPGFLLNDFKVMDCKKKTILMASFMRLKHGPKSYRYALTSRNPNKKIGHIFTQVRGEDGLWYNADATYRNNSLGQLKRVTAFEIVNS